MSSSVFISQNFQVHLQSLHAFLPCTTYLFKLTPRDHNNQPDGWNILLKTASCFASMMIIYLPIVCTLFLDASYFILRKIIGEENNRDNFNLSRRGSLSTYFLELELARGEGISRANSSTEDSTYFSNVREPALYTSSQASSSVNEENTYLPDEQMSTFSEEHGDDFFDTYNSDVSDTQECTVSRKASTETFGSELASSDDAASLSSEFSYSSIGLEDLASSASSEYRRAHPIHAQPANQSGIASRIWSLFFGT